LLASAVLAGLVVPLASAGRTPPRRRPAAASSAASKLKKLQKEVAALQQQVDQLEGKSGPAGPVGLTGAQGPPGSPGSTPTCQGNGSGDEMVAAGAVCIDKYEDSVWSSPTGGVQYGVNTDDYPCSDNGQDCTNIYARSVPGVKPSVQISFFQAQQALANVGKRLPTNAEWQQAVAGTPDTSVCNSSGVTSVRDTAADPACVSRFGAVDMIGNVEEWTADWDETVGTGTVPSCVSWPAPFGVSDSSCVGSAPGDATTTKLRFPGVFMRGGSALGDGGAFAVQTGRVPSDDSGGFVGFRGAR